MKSLDRWLPFNRNRTELPVSRSGETSGPVHPIVQMRREMDDIFDRFFGNAFGSTFGTWPVDFDIWYGDYAPRTFAPSIDIADEDKHIRVTAELPGLEQKDVDLTVRDNALYLRGEKKFEQTKEDERFYRTERSYGRFERTVPLPVEVDPNGAEATFRQGVLTVRLPKTGDSAAEPKQVPIESS